ncbi:hypothetical protein [Bacillus sp. FJAT-29790]|uniref:hypothetical protein n=1 Tax=Bacillus sp. FJAT-29790 TaxID=1895002 RepID=UPI0020B1F76F|nr:hypothetical protein [Bacillus sp. FJAT-29790]
MRRRYSPHTLPPWLKTIRGACAQFVIPFCCFQGIRVIIFPTTFDVLFLAILIFIAVALRLEFL